MIVLAFLTFALAVIAAPVLALIAWVLTRVGSTRDQGIFYLRMGLRAAVAAGVIGILISVVRHDYEGLPRSTLSLAGAGYTVAHGLATLTWRRRVRAEAQLRRTIRDA